MKLNFETFANELKPFEVKEKKNQKDYSKMIKVIHYLWTHTPTAEIDFDSFSVEDVSDAMDEMENLPFIWDEGHESFICDPYNKLVMYEHVTNVIYALVDSQEKRYVIEEEDIFL
ncbi:hypothetical protein ACFVAD_18910 [Sutcliffiella sp. NPDC057660]|uniref:hypothetical protein n=1 Tax=Sutcliffiella sp. NPDC057660 TaxID=3346199 RepID=UPI0036C99AEB